MLHEIALHVPNGQSKLHANGDKPKVIKERVSESLLEVENVKSEGNLDFFEFEKNNKNANIRK